VRGRRRRSRAFASTHLCDQVQVVRSTAREGLVGATVKDLEGEAREKVRSGGSGDGGSY